MAYDRNNIFAKILRGELPSNKVFENEWVIAFHDISPAAPVHVLVVPKGEYVNYTDFMENAPEELKFGFLKAVNEVANSLMLHETGFRLITNQGKDANQTVPHFHIHILGGGPLGPLLAGDSLHR
jgi:histidine triad (HIT) family protein